MPPPCASETHTTCDRPRECNLAADRVCDVLIPRDHGRAGPTHDGHHRPLWHAEDKQHSRCGVAGVMETGVTHASAFQQRPPFAVVAVWIDRSAEPGGEEPAALLPERAGRESFGELGSVMRLDEGDESLDCFVRTKSGHGSAKGVWHFDSRSE